MFGVSVEETDLLTFLTMQMAKALGFLPVSAFPLVTNSASEHAHAHRQLPATQASAQLRASYTETGVMVTSA